MTAILAPGDVPFTLRGALAGARRSVPLAVSVIAYGTVFGVLARQAGLSFTESVLMSGLVYAGSTQFVTLELWAMPLPMFSLMLTTLAVNLRHILMGAALRPWFGRLPTPKAYGSLFFLTDETRALSVGEYERGERDAAFFLGSGLTLYGAWLSATVVGHAAGSAIGNPVAWGLDFAFTAVFAVLLAGMYRGRGDLLSWVLAAVVAVAAERLLPSNWYILLGGIAGSVVGGVRDAH